MKQTRTRDQQIRAQKFTLQLIDDLVGMDDDAHPLPFFFLAEDVNANGDAPLPIAGQFGLQEGENNVWL